MNNSVPFIFHTGPDGFNVPDTWYEEMDRRGLPFAVKVTDAAPNIKALAIARASDVPHVIVFRRSIGKFGSIGVYDVPDYNKPFAAASEEHWQLHRAELPPEVVEYKDVVWVETINEPDKDDPARVEWLADFSVHQAGLAWRDGYKYAAFGWAGGTPEPFHWDGPRMLNCLWVMAANRHRFGLAVHEYALSQNIWNMALEDGSYWLVGRLTHLHEACDRNGILRPSILITEWGWGRDPNTLPQQNQRMIDYAEVADFYRSRNEQGNILCTAVWALNAGWAGDDGREIHEILIDDVRGLFDLMIEQSPPVVVPPPSGSVEAQIYHLGQAYAFPVNTGAALQQAMLKDAHFPTGGEQWHVVNKVNYALQPSAGQADTDDKRTYYAVVGDWGNVHWTDDGVAAPPPKPSIIVDASGWNAFDLSLMDIQGAIVRTSNGVMTKGDSESIGENGIDRYLFDHLDNLDKNALPFGLYHFVNKDYGADEQVAHFLGIVDDVIAKYGRPSLGLWIDFEKRSPVVEGEIKAACDAFLRLNNTGVAGGIYTSKTWWNPKVSVNSDWPCVFNIWTAHYPKSGDLAKPLPADYAFRTPHHWKESEANVWQFTSRGGGIVGTSANIDVNWWYDLDSVASCNDVPPVIPPPSGKQVDLRPYFEPTGQYGDYVVFQFSDGRTQAQQLAKLPDGTIALFKGEGNWINGKKYQDYERFRFKDGEFQRSEDTSVGGAKAYTQHWARWLPEVVTIGAQYRNDLRVTEYDRTNCNQLASNKATDYIKVVALHQDWLSPAKASISYDDVLELEWTKSPNGTVIERYFLAKNVSYCAWNNGAVSERPNGRDPLGGELWGCSDE